MGASRPGDCRGYVQVPVDGGGGEAEASKQPPPLHGIICLRRFCTTLSWPRRGCPAVLNCVKPRGGGALLWCRLKPRGFTPRWTHVKSVCGSMLRVSAGVSELTRRRPARRISGQEISAGVGLRSLRCSLGSTIKDVELGVEYQQVAAGGSVGHVVLGGSGLHRLLHGARSGSDKALPKSTDTWRPRLVSQKRKGHRQRLRPLHAKLASATIKGAR